MDWATILATVATAVFAVIGWSIKTAFDSLVESVGRLRSAVQDLSVEIQQTNQRLAKIEEWQRIFEKLDVKA